MTKDKDDKPLILISGNCLQALTVNTALVEAIGKSYVSMSDSPIKVKDDFLLAVEKLERSFEPIMISAKDLEHDLIKLRSHSKNEKTGIYSKDQAAHWAHKWNTKVK